VSGGVGALAATGSSLRHGAAHVPVHDASSAFGAHHRQRSD
jgi:hypothetical protein